MRIAVGAGKANLANDGHDTRALQHYLGHKNIQHTVRYTELSPDRFRDFWRDYVDGLRHLHTAAHLKGVSLKGSIAILCCRCRHCPQTQFRGKGDPLGRGKSENRLFTPAMPPGWLAKNGFWGGLV